MKGWNILTTIYCLVMLSCFFGCSNHRKKPIALNMLTEKDSMLVLQNWHVVGPFRTDQNIDMLNVDNLSPFGFKEGILLLIKYSNYILS